MDSPSFQNGKEALQSADSLVIKIGGENAVRFGENFLNAQERIDGGQKVTFVVSALRGGRNGGFNTTSQLISIAHCLGQNDTRGALAIAEHIEQWTRHTVQAEIEQDTSLDSGHRERLLAMLLEILREEIQTLRLHILSHAHGQLHSLKEDWVLQNGEYFSITGWGEHLAQLLYRQYCEYRGIASAASRSNIIAQELYGEQPLEVLQCEQTCAERLDILRARLRHQCSVLDNAGYKLAIYPGHFPLLSTERGYSDTGAAIVAQAAKEARNNVVCLIRKVSPVMDQDPSGASLEHPAQVISHLTYERALQLMLPGGSAAGVVHPRAMKMFSDQRIPVVVCSPADERSERTTLIS